MTDARPVYLDNHSTTRVDPRVLEAMLPYFCDEYGNAASVSHSFGKAAAGAVETAREQVARLVGCEPRCIVFTSGATEANNLALKGVLGSPGPAGHLIVNAGEHRAILDPADRLSRRGVAVTVLPVDQHARPAVKDIQAAINPPTRLASVMWANNEVGTLNPVAEIARVCRQRDVFFHCDAAQVLGKIPIEWDSLEIDLLSLSAHKLHGPKGVGALVVRRGQRRIPIEPLLDGGGQEHKLRSGTLPVPLIVGFGVACEIARTELAAEPPRLAALRDRLWAGLQTTISGIIRNGDPDNGLPNNLSVSIPGVDGDALLGSLKEVAVSSGSACTSANPTPSHVLQAIGHSDALARASLRFGLGRFNTEADIETAISSIAAVVRKLREMPRPA